MRQRSYKIHFVVTDCCRQHSWRYAANTLSCSLGMCVYILCTLFIWRCSTFGFIKGGLTREAPSETMKGIKWYIQIQMRGHTSSYYTPCSCTDCRREHCVLSKHHSGLHLKEEIKKKDWIQNWKLPTWNKILISSEGACVCLPGSNPEEEEEAWGEQQNLQSRDHISTFY